MNPRELQIELTKTAQRAHDLANRVQAAEGVIEALVAWDGIVDETERNRRFDELLDDAADVLLDRHKTKLDDVVTVRRIVGFLRHRDHNDLADQIVAGDHLVMP